MAAGHLSQAVEAARFALLGQASKKFQSITRYQLTARLPIIFLEASTGAFDAEEPANRY
jgi:hypothetical protein